MEAIEKVIDEKNHTEQIQQCQASADFTVLHKESHTIVSRLVNPELLSKKREDIVSLKDGK